MTKCTHCDATSKDRRATFRLPASCGGKTHTSLGEKCETMTITEMTWNSKTTPLLFGAILMKGQDCNMYWEIKTFKTPVL